MIYTVSKKFYLLSVVLLSLFVLTACGKKENVDVVVDANTNDQQVQVSEDGQEGLLKTTMEDIFKKGKPTTCTFTINEDGQSLEGMLYVDGKKMRYGSKGNVEGQNFEGNMIIKDGFSYSWTNMDSKGYKMKEIEGEDESEENNDEDIGSEERVQEMDFDCKKGVEAGIFELPSNITFEEFTMPVGM